MECSTFVYKYFSSAVFHHFNFILAHEKRRSKGISKKKKIILNSLHWLPLGGYCCIPLLNVTIKCLCVDSGMWDLDHNKLAEQNNKKNKKKTLLNSITSGQKKSMKRWFKIQGADTSSFMVQSTHISFSHDTSVSAAELIKTHNVSLLSALPALWLPRQCGGK